MDGTITDVATANASLNKVRNDLTLAVAKATEATAALRAEVVYIRPTGRLTVNQMANAVGRDRDYIDGIWSQYGGSAKASTQRDTGAADMDTAASTDEYRRLAEAAHRQMGTANTASLMRAERDRVITMVYASKLIGPHHIAAAVGVDRNHVLRIVRKAGIDPQYRPGTKNQHNTEAALTAKAKIAAEAKAASEAKAAAEFEAQTV